jgi:hypothetical protein
MRVSRIRPNEEKGPCTICHSRAVINVTFGPNRPALRLCFRDAKYLGDFLIRRCAEHERGDPIPEPQGARDDNWGNR